MSYPISVCVSFCIAKAKTDTENQSNLTFGRKQKFALITDIALATLVIAVGVTIALSANGVVNLGQLSGLGSLGTHTAYLIVGCGGAIITIDFVSLLVQQARRINQQKQESTALHSTINRLQTQVHTFQLSAQDLRCYGKQENKENELNDKIIALRSQLAEKDSVVQQTTTELTSKLEQLKQQLTEEGKEKQELQTQLNEKLDSEQIHHKTHIETVEQEGKTLNEQLTKLQAKLEKKTEKIRALQGNIASCEQTNDELREQTKSAYSGKEDDSIIVKHEQLQNKLNSMEAEKEELGNQLITLTKQYEEQQLFLKIFLPEALDLQKPLEGEQIVSSTAFEEPFVGMDEAETVEAAFIFAPTMDHPYDLGQLAQFRELEKKNPMCLACLTIPSPNTGALLDQQQIAYYLDGLKAIMLKQKGYIQAAVGKNPENMSALEQQLEVASRTLKRHLTTLINSPNGLTLEILFPQQPADVENKSEV